MYIVGCVGIIQAGLIQSFMVRKNRSIFALIIQLRPLLFMCVDWLP
tara:strand:- start:8000 stop:8137 length:138 start_codon:yes stop_codon:yes gene_type:complete